MNIITHALTGWCIAQPLCREKRDILLLTIASTIPDIDGLGILLDLVTGSFESKSGLFSTYHHVFAHNLAAAVITSLAICFFARERFKTGFFSFLVFHLHLLADIAGSRGPDGEQWPIPYLYPFSKDFELVWSGQWEVNAWPNIAVTIILIYLTLSLARTKGFSPIWFLSRRADAAIVETLRNRFPLRADHE